MAEVFKPLYLPGAQKQDIQPSFVQTLTSAFNLESDVVNVYDAMTRPVFEPDTEFNFMSAFKEAQLPVEWMPMVSAAQSKPEFDSLVGRVQKEYKDKAVLAASGWSGTVAALGAGMLSPTIFIPFGGQARGLKGMAEMLALAAAGSSVQNAALFYNQSTRTEAELYSGIAMDTLLMGMMGGAWMGLTGRARAKLATDIPFHSKSVEFQSGAMDAPTGEVKTLRVDDLEPAEVKLEVREQGIRDPEEVKQLELEAGISDAPISLRDKALAIKPATRVSAKSLEEELSYGKRFLQAEVADGVVARFTKVPAGSGGKWFTGGEYAITLHTADGVEISIPLRNQTTHSRAGNTMISKEAELKEALASGKLDDQLYDMLEAADEPRMASSTPQGAISSTRSTDATTSVGAAVSRTRNTRGAAPAPSRARQAAMDVLGHMSPAYRMLTNKLFPSLRHGIAKIDLAGVRQGGLEVAEPSASGGTVIERIRGYDFHIVNFAKTLDKNYYRYIHGTDKGYDFGSPAITQLKSQMGILPGGKMNWTQYKAAVFDALNTGEIPPDLADSVSAFENFFKVYTDRQKQYLDEMRAQGLDVEPLFRELDEKQLGKGVKNYAHHIFNKQTLMEKMGEFLDDFAGYNEKNLQESFAKARARYARQRAKLETEKMIAEMDPEQISTRLGDVEGDLEFLEEIPEWQQFRAQRAELNKRAKDEGWTKEKLKEEQKHLQDNLTPDVKAIQDERKGLMTFAKTLRKYGGDSAAQTERLQKEIDKADEAIDKMFREEIPAIRRFDLDTIRTGKKELSTLKPVIAALGKVVKSLEKRQARMSKLLASTRNNTASRRKVAELIEKDKLKYAAITDRLSAVQTANIPLEERLQELAYLREEAVQAATQIVRKRVTKLEDLEDRLEAEAAKLLTPEERARMRDQVAYEMERRETDFQRLWSERGESSGDSVNTDAPDFSEKAREMAVMLHQKLMNTEVELSPAYRALRQDARGAELLRVMKIPYAIKNKWLEKDVELVTRAYDRTMGPDLELWRAFDGSVNAKSLLGEMQDEALEHLNRINTAKYVKLPKGLVDSSGKSVTWTEAAAKFSQRVKDRLADIGEADNLYLDPRNFSDDPGKGFVELNPELRNQLSAYVNDATEAAVRDLDIAIQRLRHTRGVPDDPKSIMWRTGKAVKNLNVVTMMGSVVPSSVSDIARPIWRHGVMRTMGHGWLPFINKLNPEAKKFRLRSKEINRRIGLNLEPMLHSRAQGVFDLAEDSIGRTKLERGLALGANKMGLIAMYDYWTAGMKTIAGNVFHATMAEYVPAVAEAWAKNQEFTGDLLQMRTYLRNLGLSDLDIHRIGTQMKQPNGVERFSNGGVLPNLEAWEDAAAYQAYQAAGLKEVNELIVTPGLEKPNWVDENMGYSMVAQFKAFTFASNSRMVMSGLQGNDPYLMQGLAFSLAFGALSYYTYAITAGGKTLEEANQMDPEKWIWESVKRGGILGALSLGTDAAGNIPAISGREPTIFTKPSGLLGAFLGPTYSQAEKVATVISQMGNDDPKQAARSMRALRQVFIPFQNHFLARQLLDRAAAALYGAP